MISATRNGIIYILQCLTVFLPICLSQDVYPLELHDPRYAQQGLALPSRVEVMVGHEALLRLSKPLLNQQTCTISTPWGENFTTTSMPHNRYERWGTGCGIRIQNIQLSDEGRWRLTASRIDHTISGFSAIHVLNAATVAESPITLSDSTTDQHVNLTELANSYCTVAKPFASSVLVPGHCEVRVDKVSRALQGVWNVQLGLPGRVAEVPLQPVVAIETERLDMGFVVDTALVKLHMYCNILHTSKNITFCRFQRTNSAQGYSVRDGLGDGHFSYYGEGFEQKHCGITIELPTNLDYSAWRCFVGVVEESGARSSMQGLVSVNAQTNSGNARRQKRSTVRASEDEEIRTVLGLNGTRLTVSCEAEFPLAYCWFRVHGPSGIRGYTPGSMMQNDEEDSSMWYTGEGLEAGDCGITFSRATSEHSGAWTCHMGHRDRPGLEVTEDFHVRVTGPLAAVHEVFVSICRFSLYDGNTLADESFFLLPKWVAVLEVRASCTANFNPEKVVRTQIGSSAVLRCRSVEGVQPLNYCRFLSPQLVGLNLDPTVTAANAILGRYHFTPDADLSQGHCSLTITHVEAEDAGIWLCAAVVNGGDLESADTMSLVIVGALSLASIVGMAASGGVLLMGLALYAGVKVTKKRIRRREAEQVEMRDLPAPRISSLSGSSGSSDENVAFEAERSSRF